MDIYVHRCDGIPDGSMLSVRAGHTRRQAPLELGRPLKFPAEVSACDEIQVDILALLGRAKLAIRPATDRYDVFLEPASGRSTMSCEMEVRRAPNVAATPTRPPGSRPPSATKRPQTAGLSRTSGCTSSRRHEVAMSAQKYMERHGLVLAVQQAMQVTVSDRPDDPLTCMANQLLLLASEMKTMALEEGSTQAVVETVSQQLPAEKPFLSQRFSQPEVEEGARRSEPAAVPGMAKDMGTTPVARSQTAADLDRDGVAQGGGASVDPREENQIADLEVSETIVPTGGVAQGAPTHIPHPPSTCARSASLSQAEHGTILGDLESEASAQAFAEESFRLALDKANHCLQSESASRSGAQAAKTTTSISGSGEDCEILVASPSTHHLGASLRSDDLKTPEAVASAKGDTEDTRFQEGSSADNTGSPVPPPPVGPPEPPVDAPPMLPPPQHRASSESGCACSSVAASVLMLVEDEEHHATRPAHQAVAIESLRGILESECLTPRGLQVPASLATAQPSACVTGMSPTASNPEFPYAVPSAPISPAARPGGTRSEATATTSDQFLEDDESVTARREFQAAARVSLENMLQSAAAAEGMAVEELNTLRVRIRSEFEARLARGELKPILSAVLPEEGEAASLVPSASGQSRSCAPGSSTVVDELEDLDQVRAAVQAGLATVAHQGNIENLIYATLIQECQSRSHEGSAVGAMKTHC